VERTGRRGRGTAPRRHLAVEEHGLRGLVAVDGVAPVLLDGVDDTDGATLAALVRVGARLALGRQIVRRSTDRHAVSPASSTSEAAVEEEDGDHDDEADDPAAATEHPWVDRETAHPAAALV